MTSAGIRHLIVVDAQRLGLGRVADLVSLACETGLTLWLFTHDRLRHEPWLTGLADWPATQLTWAECEKRLPAPVATDPPVGRSPGFTLDDLPASDLWTFRADCRRTMPPAMFAAADAVFTKAALDTEQWVPGCDKVEIEKRIVELTGNHSSAGERLVALRGLQVGLLRGAWHVGVAFDSYATFAGEHPGRLIHDEDERWTRLTRWWQPHRGAVCALAAMNIAADVIAELAMSDVGDTTVQTPTGDVTIPEPARMLLISQRVARLAEAATPTDPFFVRGDGREGAVWVRNLVNSAVDAGAVIPLPADGSRQRWHNTHDIAARLGIKFNALRGGGLTTPVTWPAHSATGAALTASADDLATALDGNFLARRRRDLGLTRRLMARAAGVSESVINQLEAGLIPPQMLARQLDPYAALLGMHVSELFGGFPPDQPEAEPSNDGAALGALLWSCDQAVPREAVIEALGWDTPRLTAAAAALNSSLATCGMRLLAGPGELTIVTEASAGPPTEQTAAVVRRQQLRSAVSLHRVKVIVDIANGTFRGNRNSKPGTTAHLRFLESAGMVAFVASQTTPVLADDVRFSLLA